MIEQYYPPRQLDEAKFNGNGRHHDMACPSCERSDSVVKASAIARSSRGRFILEDGTSAAYETELGSLLSRPARPELLPLSVVVTAFIVGWLLLALDLAIVAGLRQQDQVSIPGSALDTAVTLGIVWFGLLLPGAAIARYMLRRHAVKKALPGWRRASQRWQTFRYCSRDDLVFVPGEGHGVEPNHIAVLYRVTQPVEVKASEELEEASA